MIELLWRELNQQTNKYGMNILIVLKIHLM